MTPMKTDIGPLRTSESRVLSPVEDMQSERPIKELLKLGCHSIQYRIRHEIFHECVSSDGMKALQTAILQDEAVKGIIDSQTSDGWLGRRFHGYDSLEAGIRLLCEKGVSPEHSALSNALLSLETNAARIAREMGTVGIALDEGGFGGTRMIQATILAYAGAEHKPLTQEQIGVALEGFRAVLAVGAIDEVTESYKGKLVFRPGVQWPSIYHLRLLALTRSWRIPKNQELVIEAVKRLVKLSPIPYIRVRHRSQLIAPASFGMQDFDPVITSMNAPQWMIWFHRMELLARLGVVQAVAELQSQVNTLRQMVDKDGGWFTESNSHNYFKQWGAYTGLMLERDWRISRRRILDLTFRSLLIRYYAMI